MNRLCAMCKTELPQEKGDAARVITGSLCSHCRESFSPPGDPMSLGHYLNAIGIPVLVMDDDVRVLGVNEPACALLGCGLENCLGRLGGDVLECAYARLPGGCGNTEHCKTCTIRRTVTTTYATGESQENIPAYQDIVTPRGTREFRFLISTEKVGNFVLLRIDEVRPNL